MSGHTGLYLKASICLCFLVAITQLTFHIVLLAMPPYGYFLQDCTYDRKLYNPGYSNEVNNDNAFAGQFMEKLFRHIGLVKLDSTSVWEVLYWLTPELILLPTTIIMYVACRFLTQRKPGDDEEEVTVQRVNNFAKKTEDRTTKVI